VPLFGKKETVSITYISHSGDVSRADVRVGDSVMEGAVKNLIDGIVAECGGACQCGTCHVYVEPQFLDRLKPIADDENEMLNTTACPRQPNSRLGCQIEVTKELDGLVVHTPLTQV
jgi:ferredoxin, 2Fe-2S